MCVCVSEGGCVDELRVVVFGGPMNSPPMITQVLRNMLNKAIKPTEPGVNHRSGKVGKRCG